MADVPIVVCTAGVARACRWWSQRQGLKIGRAAENDIVLEDGVSRFHASLILDNGTLWLRDGRGMAYSSTGSGLRITARSKWVMS